jgi:peroxiredoxin (alkyl hydroperoxide reductase subunit C)
MRQMGMIAFRDCQPLEARLSDHTPLKLGQRVPDFELETYEPAKGDFGTFSLAAQIEKKRWTILFFYPADFTFV